MAQTLERRARRSIAEVACSSGSRGGPRAAGQAGACPEPAPCQRGVVQQVSKFSPPGTRPAQLSRSTPYLLQGWSGNAGYLLPLISYRGRQRIHPLKEHRYLPNIFFVQRRSKAWHRGEANPMLYLPERRRLRIVFDTIPSELRCFDVEALRQPGWHGVRCAMTYRAVLGVQMYPGDQILVGWLKRIAERFGVALDCRVQRRVGNPLFQRGGLAIGVRWHDACLDGEESRANEYDQCEDDAGEETNDQSHRVL